ncbi:biotin-dependent carboxyltransferase family protein [Thiofaba sp. EF100]|uniref:5-oxoprolinase subunit C family protein n=1 Tax=Thiofaba sp. EF100 TaxID=3121274 RepID=UPI003221CE54
MSLRVLKPGILALPQDGGRRGLMHTGLTQGGPLDLHAWAWANRLLDNPWGAGTIEIHYGGLELQAEADVWLALTGADLEARIDSTPLAPWQSFLLRRGQHLRFGRARHGLRAYLAVAGGFAVHGPTVPREGLGGLHGDGRPLAAGDRLPCLAGLVRPRRSVPPRLQPDYHAPLSLRLIPGSQFASFPSATRARLFDQTWHLSPRSDRMGARLEGAPLDAPQGLISEGMALGAVQVPPDGQPIILLNDRQTLGGYPKLGAIHPLDLAALAQRLPGTALHLRALTLREAQAEMRTFLSFFHTHSVPT